VFATRSELAPSRRPCGKREISAPVATKILCAVTLHAISPPDDRHCATNRGTSVRSIHSKCASEKPCQNRAGTFLSLAAAHGRLPAASAKPPTAARIAAGFRQPAPKPAARYPIARSPKRRSSFSRNEPRRPQPRCGNWSRQFRSVYERRQAPQTRLELLAPHRAGPDAPRIKNPRVRDASCAIRTRAALPAKDKTSPSRPSRTWLTGSNRARSPPTLTTSILQESNASIRSCAASHRHNHFALSQAKQADRNRAGSTAVRCTASRGRQRSARHRPGIPTRTGAQPTAPCAHGDCRRRERLHDAGAVLIAKSSMGALGAQRHLSAPDHESVGCSRRARRVERGPGAATRRGPGGLSVGSETEAVSSSAMRCGDRPSPRTPCPRTRRRMTLCWSLDKPVP